MSNLRRISWVFLLINQARWVSWKTRNRFQLIIDSTSLGSWSKLVKFAGLSDLMLCTGCICRWGIPPYSVEYWWSLNDYRMLWMHGLATFHVSLWRGIAWSFLWLFFPSGAVHIHFSGIDLVSLLGVCVSFFSFFSWAAKEGCSLDGNCTPPRGFYRSSDWSGHSDWSKVHVTWTICFYIYIYILVSNNIVWVLAVKWMVVCIFLTFCN